MPGPFFLAPAAERDSLMKFRPWSLAERGLLALWLSLLLHAALLWLPARLGQPAAHAGLLVRLGADIYYPARELDQLAQEQGAITLPDVELDGQAPPALTVLVFISETGRVDGVRFEGAAPARLADAISPVFGAASYQPALKDGVPVKSYKRIRIEPQPAAALPPLSH